MKKVSTAAAKGTKNLQDHKLTIGLNLGDRWSWYCVLDKAGEILLEQNHFGTDRSVFLVFAGQSFSGRPARKVFGTLEITVAFDEIARCGGIEGLHFL